MLVINHKIIVIIKLKIISYIKTILLILSALIFCCWIIGLIFDIKSIVNYKLFYFIGLFLLIIYSAFEIRKWQIFSTLLLIFICELSDALIDVASVHNDHIPISGFLIIHGLVTCYFFKKINFKISKKDWWWIAPISLVDVIFLCFFYLNVTNQMPWIISYLFIPIYILIFSFFFSLGILAFKKQKNIFILIYILCFLLVDFTTGIHMVCYIPYYFEIVYSFYPFALISLALLEEYQLKVIHS
jgi:hypothetical protein